MDERVQPGSQAGSEKKSMCGRERPGTSENQLSGKCN